MTDPNQGDKLEPRRQFRFDINSEEDDTSEEVHNEQIVELNMALANTFIHIAETRDEDGEGVDIIRPSDVIRVERDEWDTDPMGTEWSETEMDTEWQGEHEEDEDADDEEDNNWVILGTEGANNITQEGDGGARNRWHHVNFRRRLRRLRPLIDSLSSEDYMTVEEMRANTTRSDENTMLWSSLAHMDTMTSSRQEEDIILPDNVELHRMSPNDLVRQGGGEGRRPRRLTRYPSFIPRRLSIATATAEWPLLPIQRPDQDNTDPEIDNEVSSLFEDNPEEDIAMFGPQNRLIYEQNIAFERALEEERREEDEGQQREQQEREERENRIQEAVAHLEEEPSEEADDIVVIRIHTTEGVLDRRFRLDDETSTLYDFMTSQGIFDITLETNNREIVTSSAKTFRELGLNGRVGLWTRYPKK